MLWTISLTKMLIFQKHSPASFFILTWICSDELLTMYAFGYTAAQQPLR
jgi:hypothetical protein